MRAHSRNTTFRFQNSDQVFYVARYRLAFYLLCFLFFSLPTFGQEEWDPKQLESMVLEESDAERSAEELFDLHIDKELRNRPIQLNGLRKDDLDRIPYLTEIEKSAILKYVHDQINITSVLELQTIEEISLEKLKTILPYLTIEKYTLVNQRLLQSIMGAGTHHITTRWRRDFYLKDEFRSINGAEPKYAGSADKFFLRYRSSVTGLYSVGFIAEKDEGERWWTKSNNSKVDFLSAHMYFEKINPVIELLAIGDYRIRIGQGLVIDNAFQNTRGFDFGMFVKNPGIIKPFNSIQENQMMRGISTRLRLSNRNTALLYYSSQKVDASILVADSTEEGVAIETFSSITLSGLHRTPTEISNRNQLALREFGASLKHQFRSGYVGAAVAFSQMGLDRNVPSDPYKKYDIKLNNQKHFSIFHQYQLGGFYTFGEIALDQTMSHAILQGILKSLGKHSEGVLMYRNFSPEFISIRSQSISISNRSSNEKGLMMGVNTSFSKSWKAGFYFDSWSHPWFRYRVDLPSYGQSWSVRIQYTKRKKWSAYAQYRIRKTETNDQLISESVLIPLENQNFRIHLEQKLNSDFSLRVRNEYHFFTRKSMTELGWMVYVDLLFKSIDKPFSSNIRVSIFDIASYNSRIYAFENDVSGIFRIPAYSGKGAITYLNLRWKTIRNLSIEGRLAIIYKSRILNPDIQKEFDSDIHLQLQYRF
ncbi:MAG: hypothetical protein IPO62_11850 [Saprospiraceae bacterium]|nr:hypothetical protein [Saprospiraceae bacterium]